MIPEAAVEAALYACGFSEQTIAERREMIRLALEAAAPHMLERAYNAGHLDGMNGAPNTNPYR